VRSWGFFFLFQLAAGGFIDGIVAAPLSLANAFFNTVQGVASSVQQQFQNIFQSVNQNISSQIDFGLGQFQQDFGYLNNSQANACMYNQTQEFYAIGNESSK
jgi:hypothetical protein